MNCRLGQDDRNILWWMLCYLFAVLSICNVLNVEVVEVGFKLGSGVSLSGYVYSVKRESKYLGMHAALDHTHEMSSLAHLVIVGGPLACVRSWWI